MADAHCENDLGVANSLNVEIKQVPEPEESPKKKRHVIKAKNVKGVTNSEKPRNSPFAKSLNFIGRLSKRGPSKPKRQLTLDESFENSTTRLNENNGDNETNGEIVKSPPLTTRLSEESCNTNSNPENVERRTDRTVAKDTTKSKKKAKKKGPSKSQTSKAVKSHVLTDYYPVRRSTRKSKSVLEQEQTDSVIAAIKSKAEDDLAVREFENKGRGVVALRCYDKFMIDIRQRLMNRLSNVHNHCGLLCRRRSMKIELAFKKGSFIVEYAGDLIDWNEAKKREVKYSSDPSIGCYIVDATEESGRLGRLLNHSRKGPNCKTKLISMPEDDEKRAGPRLIIIAKRDIGAGEELTYDYGDRDKETLQSHPWLKLA